ncbi:MAG: hypothetical protein PHF37_03975 [Phycisphaerae bacterium]|nr:hypothetical protein [Phycisphaerae bacterium]
MKKLLIYVCCLGLIMVIAGCESSSHNQVKTTSLDEKKATLVKKINKKYDNPGPHYELGFLYEGQGLWLQAENEYNLAISFNPGHRGAQAGLVKVLGTTGNTEKSKITAELFIEQVKGSASGSLELAMGFQKHGLDDYALRTYKQALSLAPDSAKVNRQIGFYYLTKGNNEFGRDYLVRSFQLDPDQPEVARELGRLGVTVQIPRTPQNGKKLDKMVE